MMESGLERMLHINIFLSMLQLVTIL